MIAIVSFRLLVREKERGLELRNAKYSELDRIMGILADGRASLAALGTDQWQGGYPAREVIDADIGRGESVVACEGTRIIATAMVACREELDYRTIENGAWLTESLPGDPCYVVVHRVAVASEGRGKGVGSAILGHAAELARSLGCASVRVDTHPGNVPMQRMLEKNGFTKCGVIRISHAEGATPERYAYEKMI